MNTAAPLPGDMIAQVVSKISSMSASELLSVKSLLYERFDVKDYPKFDTSTITAPVEKVEEQTEFTVIIADAGSQKLQVIKLVRELTGLALAESKALVDNLPSAIKENISKDEADKLKTQLEEIGAKIELK